MSKFNDIEEFFAYAFSQAKTKEQRFALYFVKEGHMLPSYLESLTWEDIDVENRIFKSVNNLGTFKVEMSPQFVKEIKTFPKKRKGNIFSTVEGVKRFITFLYQTLQKDQPFLQLFSRDVFGRSPKNQINDLEISLNQHITQQGNGQENTYLGYFKLAGSKCKENQKLLVFVFLAIKLEQLGHVFGLKWSDVSKDNQFIRNPYFPTPNATNFFLPQEVAMYLKNHRGTEDNYIFKDTPKLRNQLVSYIFSTTGGVLDYNKSNSFYNCIEGLKVNGGANKTRDCLDPWNYIEFKEDGKIAPCCKIQGLDSFTEFSSEVRELKKELINGQLRGSCVNCHIRDKIDVTKFNEKVKVLQAKQKSSDLLKELPLSVLRIEVTGRCNLRCTYCAVSAPSYQGKDVQDVTFQKAMKMLKTAPKNVTVYLNGHGEATFHPKWKDYAQKILVLGFKPEITTNLAREYKEEEIATLAQFRTIQVSLDSHDEEMMRTIRKAVKPEKVFRQIERIRTSAKAQGIKSPRIQFSVGVYDPSIWTMEAFMSKLVALDVVFVTFWNMVVYEHTTLVKPLSSLQGGALGRAKEEIWKSFIVLQKAGIQYEISGGFIEDNKSLYQKTKEKTISKLKTKLGIYD